MGAQEARDGWDGPMYLRCGRGRERAARALRRFATRVPTPRPTAPYSSLWNSPAVPWAVAPAEVRATVDAVSGEWWQWTRSL